MWCLYITTKHWLDKSVQMEKSKFNFNIFWFFDLYYVIKSMFRYHRKTPSILILCQNVFYKVRNIFLQYLNVLFFCLDYLNIVSKLNIVKFEISIYICFVLDFFCKSIKRVSQNMSLYCPTLNIEGLANMMRL